MQVRLCKPFNRLGNPDVAFCPGWCTCLRSGSNSSVVSHPVVLVADPQGPAHQVSGHGDGPSAVGTCVRSMVSGPPPPPQRSHRPSINRRPSISMLECPPSPSALGAPPPQLAGSYNEPIAGDENPETCESYASLYPSAFCVVPFAQPTCCFFTQTVFRSPVCTPTTSQPTTLGVAMHPMESVFRCPLATQDLCCCVAVCWPCYRRPFCGKC